MAEVERDQVNRLVEALRDASGHPFGLLRSVVSTLGGRAAIITRHVGASAVVHGVHLTSDDKWDEATRTFDAARFNEDQPSVVALVAARVLGFDVAGPWIAERAITEPVIFGINGAPGLYWGHGGLATLLEMLAARNMDALSERLNAIQVERARIASAIHETVAQELTTLNMQLDTLQDLLAEDLDAAALLTSDVRFSARRALKALRETITDLTPVVPGEHLEDRLRGVLQEFRDGDVDVAFDVDEPLAALDDRVTELVIGFLREAISNVGKHAGGRGTVIVRTAGRHLELTVRSEHHGDGPSMVPGHGLDVVRNYARLIGGDVSITRSSGTSDVRLTVPT